jgi:hypothetical protein
MSAETITPTPTAPAGVTVATLPVVPGPALVNALLQWPEKDRVALAILLHDSVKTGFNSLEEKKARDKELIRSRLESLLSGKAELLDIETMFEAMDAAILEARKA